MSNQKPPLTPRLAPPQAPQALANRAIFITRAGPDFPQGRVLADPDGALAQRLGDATRPASPGEAAIAGLSPLMGE